MKAEVTYTVSQEEFNNLVITKNTVRNICRSFGECHECPLYIICAGNDNCDGRLDELINNIIQKSRVVD